MNKIIITILSLNFLFISCSDALDPLDNGLYTDENLSQYPSLIKGFVDQAYNLAFVKTYDQNEYAFMDCVTDNAVATSTSNKIRKLANGGLSPSNDPFKTYWKRDYKGIYYVNKFLQDNIGYNTHYLQSIQADSILRKNYQGDAYALRAWFEYDLLTKFGGRGMDGEMYGFPILTYVVDQGTAEASSFERNTYDDCVRQILADCDSALNYLPIANRDWVAKDNSVEGACRWGRFDQVSIKALKALTYLVWASDAFNPLNDMSRWENAAKFAAEVMQYKLNEDAPHGFSPYKALEWTDPNSPEACWCSIASSKTTTMEINQYPNGFNGTCAYAPTQELVDAFPASDGYPIEQSSVYNPSKPYENRDPRFYATIFYNGSTAIRAGKSEVMYTFDMTTSGKDRDGLVGNGLTNYYLKKFIYMGWNPNEQNIQSMPRMVLFLGWRDMCFALAEAANRVAGPLSEKFGISAKQALSYIRSRSTLDGKQGVGKNSDPYLDECCSSPDAFESLLRNERRIEFCFEGKRFLDLSRWNIPISDRNKPVSKVTISTIGDKVIYVKSQVDMRKLSSPWLPIPYDEIYRAKSIVQNEGWESWSIKRK